MNDTPRPNIILVVTDQHRWDHVGFNGNTVVQTPHLDNLADNGVVFSRTHVASPTCMPNRASLLTGRSPSAHGLRTNGMPLDLQSNTFVKELRSSGYRTRLVGKAHLQPYGIAVEREAGGESADPAELLEQGYGWELRARFERGDVEMPDDYYGFEQAELTCGHGDDVGGHYVSWLRSRGVDPDAVRGRENARVISQEWDQVYQPAVDPENYPTSFVAERAVAAIKEYSESADPYFLMVSFPDPHHPFTPPGEYWSMYDPDSMPLPKTFDVPHEDAPAHIQSMLERRGTGGDEYVGWSPTPEQYRQALAAEYGMISMIDSAVGRIMEALEASGERENTTVIFTSDHGDMFGDHGLMFKHAMHYEACTRVPLVVSCPPGDRTAGRYDGIVSTLDIPATVLDMAGLQRAVGQQGRTLLPTLVDRTEEVRDSTLIEEDQDFGLPGLPGPIRMRTVVTLEGRLTLYGAGESGELYDHAADPSETRNLFGKPAHAHFERRMRDSLLSLMISADDRSRVPDFSG